MIGYQANEKEHSKKNTFVSFFLENNKAKLFIIIFEKEQSFTFITFSFIHLVPFLFVHNVSQMVTSHYIERRTCSNGNSFNSISRQRPKFWNLLTFFFHYKMLTIIPIFEFVKFTKTTCNEMQN